MPGRGLGSGGILQSFGCQDQTNGYPEEVEEKNHVRNGKEVGE